MVGAAEHRPWLAAAPALFVVLWSTGFIGGKLGLPYAEPLTFLLVRFTVVTALMLVVALAARAPWPRDTRTVARVAVAGVLMHGVYLGGVFCAMRSVPAGVTALIAGLQPLLTAALSGPLLGERVSSRQWIGLALGFAGAALVVGRGLGAGPGRPVDLALAFVALLGITAGTLHQKRHGAAVDLRTGAVIQYAAATLLMLVLAPLSEAMRVTWSGEFIFALTWLSLVLSVGAISLLYLLLRRGAASRVASLFYAVPPCTALMAYLLFGETLTPLMLVGMAVALAGVALVVRAA